MLSPAPRTTVVLPRFVLTAATELGADRTQLLHETRLTPSMLEDAQQIPTTLAVRVWEVCEWALDDPYSALAIASRYRMGVLDLYDYLFVTSDTLGDGLSATAEYLFTATTACTATVVERDDTVDLEFSMGEGGGHTRDLATQYALGVFTHRIVQGTGKRVAPVHVGLTQRPPRSHEAFNDIFGTMSVDFDAHTNSVTVRKSDLTVPLPGSDPVLAKILKRFATQLLPSDHPPPPDPAGTSWLAEFRIVLDTHLARGAATRLDTLARHFAISPRTLQRLLTRHGTTWRGELDAARRREMRRLHGTSDEVAQRLGYSEARALRRARHRWNAVR
ncbi:AraC family transcriptional regulator [Nocardia terpenica]|uniref:HTH-type transcriptional regulator AraC-type N-terminal domain-containing protein n=1 Tax=Nocardia terpenica TaxID=455432 RepID=A0A161ZA53_9NOCA|nr:AraC family transcriptional regulator [Nocardia terpenica]KZM76022.1 hypothetical protein AWN90_17125 [Nocardia terpenica]NQE85571.1 hypothetical protein [Nocardia terpenica]